MGRRPAIRGGGTAGEPLRRIARGVLGEARAAIEDGNRSEADAVHEFRKAMKRWRALLRLLEPFLGESGRRLRLQARDLARELARPRDAQSALDGLQDALRRDAEFSPRSLQAIRGRLEEVRQKAETAMLTTVVRGRMTAAIRGAARAVDRWPVTEIGFTDLTDRLTETYRRARRMIPDEWSDAAAEDLHELRRRVIEHRYQMELVEPLWPRLGKLWVEEAQRLRDRLGRYQDLVVLSGLAAPHQLLAPWRSRLSRPIAARQAVHLTAAARLAGRLFAERPKAFRRRLRAMWEARAKPGGQD
ncbi:MAG: CHAD domain-containing protein [Xanthobacteraceae bacterium]